MAVRVRGNVCERDAVWDTTVLSAPETLRHLISTTQRHLPERREGECLCDDVVLILLCCCCCLNPTFAIELRDSLFGFQQY